MKILKYILVISLFYLSLNSSAQNFYLSGGVNISNILEPKEGDNLNRSKQLGYQVGVIMDIKLFNNLFFSPQASIAQKKEKCNQEFLVQNPDNINNVQHLDYIHLINNYYIDVPLAFRYSFSLKNIELYPFAGPYVSLLLHDNSEAEWYLNGVPHEMENKLYPLKEKFINKLDYGLNIGLGLNYKAVLINLAADFGMFREMKYENIVIDQKYKNTVFKLSLGYKI